MNYAFSKEQYQNQDIGVYESYAIRLFNNGEQIRHIPDVFLNNAISQKFTALCNRLALDPIHLDDVINDYLNDIRF